MTKGALWIKDVTTGCLVPADPVTEAWLANIKRGEHVLTSTPLKPRNPEFHRLMMALLTIVVEHTWPHFADVDALMRHLKLKTGMVERIQVVEGVVELEFKSISFAEMDEIQFRAVSEQWRAVICTELMPGTDPEELLREAA